MSKSRIPVFTGLMTALVFLMTYIIKIPVPYTSGYIHLGDSMIFLSVMVVGPFYGAFAAGVGSMLSDLAAGYAQYALPTLVIKALMAMVMGLVMSGTGKRRAVVSAGIVAAVWAGFVILIQTMLNRAVSTYGDGLAALVLENGTPQELSDTNALAQRIPTYLTLGLCATLVFILIVSAVIMRRVDGEKTSPKAILGMSAAGIVMIAGYFVTETAMYGLVPPIFSIPMNLVQFAGGILVATALTPVVRRVLAGVGRNQA